MAQRGRKPIVTRLEKVDPKTVTLEELATKYNDLVSAIVGDRPTNTEGEMTDEMATRILVGDLSGKSVTEAAKVLGVSYGQAYAVKNGTTFKHVREKLERDIAK